MEDNATNTAIDSVTRSCKMKNRILGRSEAKSIAKKMSLKYQNGRIRAYKCRYCECYHIGHDNRTLFP